MRKQSIVQEQDVTNSALLNVITPVGLEFQKSSLSIGENIGKIYGLMGYFTMFTALIFGLAADFILKAGNYTSKKNTTLAYAVYSIWFIGNYIPLYLTRESYFADLVSGYGQEYVDTLRAYTPGWMFLVLLVACFIGGLIGAALGKAVLKKHFVRAGIV